MKNLNRYTAFYTATRRGKTVTVDLQIEAKTLKGATTIAKKYVNLSNKTGKNIYTGTTVYKLLEVGEWNGEIPNDGELYFLRDVKYGQIIHALDVERGFVGRMKKDWEAKRKKGWGV